MPSNGPVRIAADVGGTFTDIALFDDSAGGFRLGKVLTTPDRLVDGIAGGIQRSGSSFAEAGLFLHGTTVAINTLLERTGARTALVTTRGFRDIYEIGRVNRPEAYNLFFRKHRPLIDRALRFEVSERVSSTGEVLQALDTAELEAIASTLEAQRIEALAILFMHSYRAPDHEIAASAFFRRRLPGLYVSASHELSQEYREFERTSTVAANAYVGPRVHAYLGEIVERLEEERFKGGFLIVQSTGGLYDARQAQRECIRMLESGPAAGVIGTRSLCHAIGLSKAIAFDMGGTTAKSGVILNGEVLMTSNSMIGGYAEGLPVQIPMIDIQEVGTGGGSMARLGPAQSLRVGPQSAGSRPGPVCYGIGGTQPTVTDANLLLGRLAAERFLGGDMRLDSAAARRAMQQQIAEPLGLGIEQAAEGIVRIAASTMSNVVKRVTTERGLDAREFPMVAFGGAGPLHVSLVARELQIGTVIIPNAPGHFSAVGMLLADLRCDYVRTLFGRLADAAFDALEHQFAELEAQGRAQVHRAAPQIPEVRIERALDMRYVGQEHAVTVDIPLGLFRTGERSRIKALFDQTHLQRYGYCSEEEPAEIVSIRTSVTGVMPKPPMPDIASGGLAPSAEAHSGTRPMYLAGAWLETPTFRRDCLRAGNRIAGPALIEEYASTTVVLPGDQLSVDRIGNLVIEVGHD
jgi:N-methylhydantoinase A